MEVLQKHLTKRSVRIGVYDEQGVMVEVGNVTIPPNQTIPEVMSLIDVEYLYAYKGGSLYQPVFLKHRTDLDNSAARISQLKYKPQGEEDEG